MDALGTYLAMGGYGAFVWPAYGVSAAVLIGLGVWIAVRLNRLRREIDQAKRPVAPSAPADDAAGDGQ